MCAVVASRPWDATLSLHDLETTRDPEMSLEQSHWAYQSSQLQTLEWTERSHYQRTCHQVGVRAGRGALRDGSVQSWIWFYRGTC